MTQDPLVTYVVPCYKLGHLLSQCVNSILAQDYKNFEVLIMDNCSPDNTAEVAQSFTDPRVQHIRNESNLGHIRNYNKGMKLARGKYVWLLSADDILKSPHVLGRYVSTMERNPQLGYVFCRAIEIRQGKEAGIARWADHGDEDQIWNGPSFLATMVQDNRITAPTVMMRKESFDKVGPFQIELPFASDWYMWCILALHFDVAYLADPMVCYRFHDDSLTTQYSSDHARICIGDELAVLWRIGQEARAANNAALQNLFMKSLIHRAVRFVKAGLAGETPGMSQAEFESIIQTRVENPRARKQIRAAVYTTLADDQFREGKHARAAESYRLGLAASPWRLKTWKKYFLLRSGVVGNRDRQSSH
jgi:glycosyltransferase involved in cell wall biosynthesis